MSRTGGCTRAALKATMATAAMRDRRATETTSVTLFFFGGTEREKGIETSKKIKREPGFQRLLRIEQLLSFRNRLRRAVGGRRTGSSGDKRRRPPKQRTLAYTLAV